MWHPALLAATSRLPNLASRRGAARRTFWPADHYSPDQRTLVAGRLGFAGHERGGARRPQADTPGRNLSAALAGLDEQPDVDPELVADFLALGYGYLAVELLTRQMRYMSNIDEVHLQNEALAAARSASRAMSKRLVAICRTASRC